MEHVEFAVARHAGPVDDLRRGRAAALYARMVRWASGQTEPCESCGRAPASRIISGVALCVTCRGDRPRESSARFGRRI